MKCEESGYIRCCGSSFTDIIRTTPKTPAIIVLASQNMPEMYQDALPTTSNPTIVETTVSNGIVIDSTDSTTFKSIDSNASRLDDNETITGSTTNIIEITTVRVNTSTLAHDQPVDEGKKLETASDINSITPSVDNTAMENISEVFSTVTEMPSSTEAGSSETTIEEMIHSTESATEGTTEPLFTVIPESVARAEIITPTLMDSADTTPQSVSEISTEMITTDTPMEHTTLSDIITTDSSENEFKSRRPKMVDNVIMIYPNEMSGVPKTTPKNMPENAHEAHVFDEDMGTALHVIFSTNQTTTKVPELTTTEKVSIDRLNAELGLNELTQSATNTGNGITVSADALASTTLTTIAPTTAYKLKRGRFSAYRARTIKKTTDTGITTTTVSPNTTRKSIIRLNSVLTARNAKTKLRVNSEIAKSTEKPYDNIGNSTVSTPTPQLVEKNRKKLFSSLNRLNFLQRKAAEATTTEASTIKIASNVTLAPAVMNNDIAATIDKDHKLMMERVRFALKSAIISKGLMKSIPRTFTGPAVNNHIETVEQIVKDNMIKSVKSAKEMLARTNNTETLPATTKKPFRGHRRYFDATIQNRERTRTRKTTKTTTTTSKPENQSMVERNLRRRLKVKTTTRIPSFLENNTTTSAVATDIKNSEESTRKVVRPRNNRRKSFRNGNVTHIRPRTTTENVAPIESTTISALPSIRSEPVFEAKPRLTTISDFTITESVTVSSADTKIPLQKVKSWTSPQNHLKVLIGLSNSNAAFTSNIVKLENKDKKDNLFRRSPTANTDNGNEFASLIQKPSQSSFQIALSPANQIRPDLINQQYNYQPSGEQFLFPINGHQKPQPLIVGLLPSVNRVPSDDGKIRFGLPAEMQRTKFYF